MTVFVHSLGSRHGAIQDGDRGCKVSVNDTVTSILDSYQGTKRNHITPSAELFAPYQPLHGEPHDVTNCFGRTLLALRIRRCIDNREDRLASLECQHAEGRLPYAEYIELHDEATAQLRRHRFALFRLNELGRN